MGALINKIYNAKKNKLKNVEIWGSGKSKREFIYVDDVSRAISKFLSNRKLIQKNLYWLNIGTGKDLNIKSLSYKISKIVGYKGKFIFNLSKPEGTKRKLLDIKKAKSQGWLPKTGLENGLKKTIFWYKNNK